MEHKQTDENGRGDSHDGQDDNFFSLQRTEFHPHSIDLTQSSAHVLSDAAHLRFIFLHRTVRAKPFSRQRQYTVVNGSMQW
jgi:hypothetical protein